MTLRRKAGLAALLLGAALLAGCAGTPEFRTLEARVVSQTPLSLGPEAELRVSLEREDGGVIAETRQRRLGDAPIPVRLSYDARSLAQGDTALHAEIREAGRLRYRQTEPRPFAPGMGEPVTLTLESLD
ncbi:YbaY family lipoprotein [Halomonas pacifica]|uniref:YbaY family lipoprotein n=1 Tax=Bisbaumannia pacifica TaxID=77098 RepID=UPI002358F010|nr:YbaY family lipoprotein [Halomonas pacifica]MDC8804510.1 YbaY family lipoprotein [Halomonas pacifica]